MAIINTGHTLQPQETLTILHDIVALTIPTPRHCGSDYIPQHCGSDEVTNCRPGSAAVFWSTILARLQCTQYISIEDSHHFILAWTSTSSLCIIAMTDTHPFGCIATLSAIQFSLILPPWTLARATSIALLRSRKTICPRLVMNLTAL